MAIEWYRSLRDDAFALPVVFVARLDGSATANVREMDKLLRETWGPINRKYAGAPEPCPAVLMAKYGRHLRKVPMLASKLIRELMCKRLQATSPSCMGPDGWSLRDLRSLPPGPCTG